VARDGVCDGFVVNGGVCRVLRQGMLAAEFAMPFWLQLVGTGLTTAFATHLGAVLPFAQWPAVTCLNNYSDDLLADPLTIHGGYLRLPESPGLGVAVDEAALERYRMAPPYELPEPRHIVSVVWPGGRAVRYSRMREQTWPDFLAGNHPVQERGVRLEAWEEDGTPEWAELYARAVRGPVRDLDPRIDAH
jgi:hypothetical protein